MITSHFDAHEVHRACARDERTCSPKGWQDEDAPSLAIDIVSGAVEAPSTRRVPNVVISVIPTRRVSERMEHSRVAIETARN